MKRMPYFDYCLKFLKQDDVNVKKAFGRNVHWGYWEDPNQAKLTVDDLALASENMSRFMIELSGAVDGHAVLDVGCGFGGTIASMNELFTEMNLTGLNIDERQLERARQQVVASPGNTILFQQGDACALPFADQSFDVVTAVECIFHFPDRELFFREAQRVLKPGGSLAVSDFLVNPYMAFWLPRKFNTGFFGVCDVKFSHSKYKKLAKKYNLEVSYEKNITRNTLPTYLILKSVIFGKDKFSLFNLFGWVTTLVVEVVTRLNLLSYSAFVFKKSV